MPIKPDDSTKKHLKKKNKTGDYSGLNCNGGRLKTEKEKRRERQRLIREYEENHPY